MSCTVQSCGFGNVKSKGIKKSKKTRKTRARKSKGTKKRGSRTKKRSKKGSKRRRSKGRKRSFGYKFRTNAQIMEYVAKDPNNLTCDRA